MPLEKQYVLLLIAGSLTRTKIFEDEEKEGIKVTDIFDHVASITVKGETKTFYTQCEKVVGGTRIYCTWIHEVSKESEAVS